MQFGFLSLSTASKVLAPGLRIGWLTVPRAILPALLELKRRTDLATCLPFSTGDRVICFEDEFPANVTPWAQAMGAVGGSITFVPPA